MRTHIFRLLFLLLCVALPPRAQAKHFAPEIYYAWNRLSSEQLMDMGHRFLTQGNSPDSALICYTIVANHNAADLKGEAQLKTMVKALNNLGYLYTNVYYDCSKAYGYLRRSIDMAQKARRNDLLASTHLNMSLLLEINDMLHGREGLSQEVVNSLRQSFQCAQKARSMKPLYYSFCDLSFICFINGRPDLARQVVGNFAPRPAEADGMGRYATLMHHAINAACSNRQAEALNYFAQMRESAKLINPAADGRGFQYIASFCMVKLLTDMGQDGKALQILASMEREAQASGDKWTLLDVYRTYKSYYARKHASALYDAYLVKFLKLKDNLVYDSQIYNLDQMRFLEELETVSAQAKEAENSQKLTRTVLISVLLISAIVIVALWLQLTNYRRRNRYIAELYQKNMQLLNAKAEGTSGSATAPSPSSPSVPSDSKAELEKRIRELLGDHSVVCDPDFSMPHLCRMLGTNSHYVSEVISNSFNSNFRSLLNSARIREACVRLSDVDHYGNLTIEAIAQSVGFKSRTTFAVSFKKATGLSPSEFQKAARSGTVAGTTATR